MLPGLTGAGREKAGKLSSAAIAETSLTTPDRHPMLRC
jgi:hypothetical protein